MSDLPKADLNIYLAKPEVKKPETILTNPASLKRFDLEIPATEWCSLFVKRSRPNAPRWAHFFAPEISTSEFGSNSSTGAILLVSLDASTFALTFGQGHHLLDSSKLEMGFGLKTMLNIVNVDGLRSLDKSSFEQRPTQTRQQTGVAAELQNFGVDIERDLLRAITGVPRDSYFGSRVSGMDALKLNVDIGLADLASLLRRVAAAYKDDSYKNGPFAWVDHIGEVKDRPTHDALDTELVRRVDARNLDRIWLTVPEIVDWNRIVGFKYSNRQLAPRHYDIRMVDLLETFRGTTPDVSRLKQRKIFCVDSDEISAFEASAYRFVYAEIDLNSDIYVLNNGKWYKISRSFAEQINHSFSAAPRYSKQLPPFQDATEGDYNQRVAQSDPEAYVLLDRENIKVAAAASPVEPCDLLRDGNEFIHVKRYGGSSVLSHLFNQGLVSGELFQMEPDFRRQLYLKLPSALRPGDPVQRPPLNHYQVVFAIISESDDELSIPFFSKISLRHALNRLQMIGFNVSIAKISVDELTKKTVFYPF